MRLRLLQSIVPILAREIGDKAREWDMHPNTKLTPPMRKEIYAKWKAGKGALSLRVLAAEYHVDKRVVSRIIARGRGGDFSVHTSTNVRYQKSRSRGSGITKRK